MSETLLCDQTPGPKCKFFKEKCGSIVFPKCIFTNTNFIRVMKTERFAGQINLGITGLKKIQQLPLM